MSASVKMKEENYYSYFSYLFGDGRIIKNKNYVKISELRNLNKINAVELSLEKLLLYCCYFDTIFMGLLSRNIEILL
jgi:hypothetical protein